MKAKKVTAIILAGAICAAAFTGCGINTGAAAASMKNQTVTMGMANFTCRYQQANVEDYYKSMMGAKSSSELWSKDLYGNGTTMEDTMKDSVMEQLHEMYTLQAHMKDYDVSVTKDEKAAIKKAAQQFISDNSSEALKEMTADEDTVEELLTLYTIRSKMQKAIEAEADTNVTDEEANERGYTMMTISTTSHQDDSGNTVEYTDDEKKQLKETTKKIEEAVKNGKTLEDAGDDRRAARPLLFWPGGLREKGDGSHDTGTAPEDEGGSQPLRAEKLGLRPLQLGLEAGHPAGRGVLPRGRPGPAGQHPAAALHGKAEAGRGDGQAEHQLQHLSEGPRRPAEHRCGLCRPLR